MSKSQYFKITLDTPILIYGYTKFAQEIANSLVKKSYSVKGYVDTRAKEMCKKDLPIYSVESIDKLDYSKEAVVIICLQNIMTQINVAEQISKEGGINRIIFLPNISKCNLQMATQMRRIYQKVCLKESLQECLVPRYDAMIENGGSIVILNQFKNCVCIMCPAQLVFTGRKNSKNSWQYKNSHIYEQTAQIYENKNIGCNKLYNSFFDYMLTGHGECDTYIETYAKITNKSKEVYFSDRVELFKLYEREFETDVNFFIETAAMAEWNSCGYFNLKDGHHRASYLLHKGHTMIPIIISNKDFEKYKNAEKEDELRKILLDNNISRLSNPEIHACIMGENSPNYIKRIIAVWRFLFENIDIEKSSYLDVSDELGFWAVNMSRMHATHIQVVVSNYLEESIMKLILQLTYQNNISIIYRERIDLKYDVVFAKKIDAWEDLNVLYRMAKKMIVFEFLSENKEICERTKRVKNDKYQKIVGYFNGDKWIECGVLIKKD